ncbi:MAG: hypothetical protein KDK51_03840 [Deltaproteobacteria bacterium]|nr:hypothetical protein [Deltaproteobacteria bacterium]
MKKIAVTLIGLCLLALGLIAISPLEKIHRFDQDVLEEQVRAIEMEIYPLMTEPKANQARITDLKKELFWFDLEIQRQRWVFDSLIWLVCILSLGYLVYAFFRGKTQEVSLVAVKEMRPTEQYVDNFGFERAQIAGFSSKEAAILWYKNDKMRVCEYCGGENVPVRNTPPNQVQFCTFYKEVPEGAKDLRIVLGSVWNVIPAPQLVCKSCSTQKQRG